MNTIYQEISDRCSNIVQKRTIFALGVALGALTCVMNAQQVVTSNSISEIEVVGPESPAFSGAVAEILKGVRNPNVEALVPYSIVVRNRSAQNIEGVAIRWTLTDSVGKSVDEISTRTLFDAKPDHQFAPGRSFLVAPYWLVDGPPTGNRPGITSRSTDVSALLQRYRAQKTIGISVDGVLFASGLFVGPDTGREFEQLHAMLTADRSLAAALLQKHQGGAPTDSIAAWLKAKAGSSSSAFGSGVKGTDWIAHYEGVAAQRLLMVLSTRGEAEMLDRARILAQQQGRNIYR